MTQRTSLLEQYNNRDVIAQIYRLISLVESSTIIRTTSVQEGSTVTVTLDMFDGTSKTFTFTNNADMTTDTEQNVTALKNFLAGLNVTGNTQIDGETQIVNGHSLQVAGDLDIAGDTELTGRLTAHGQSEIAGMAIEESSGATVLSNANGIKSASPITLSGDVVVPTTVTGQRDTEAVNGERLQNDLDTYSFMLRTVNDQQVSGLKDFLNNIRRTSPDWSYYECKSSNINKTLAPGSTVRVGGLGFLDVNNQSLLNLNVEFTSGGVVRLFVDGTKSDGSYWQHEIHSEQVIL